jgi:hypothetical protein
MAATVACSPPSPGHHGGLLPSLTWPQPAPPHAEPHPPPLYSPTLGGGAMASGRGARRSACGATLGGSWVAATSSVWRRSSKQGEGHAFSIPHRQVAAPWHRVGRAPICIRSDLGRQLSGGDASGAEAGQQAGRVRGRMQPPRPRVHPRPATNHQRLDASSGRYGA